MEYKIKHKGKQERNTSMLSLFHKIGKKSNLVATKTDEAEASTEMVDANQALPTVPTVTTAWGKLRTRSCEGMLIKPHKPKISETIRYYLKSSDQVDWGKTLQDKHEVYIIHFLRLTLPTRALFIQKK